jgi:hypothetical protein
MKRTIIDGRRYCEVVERCRGMKRGAFIISRCMWCRLWFTRARGRGRPAMYCSDDCASCARSDQRRYGVAA